MGKKYTNKPQISESISKNALNKVFEVLRYRFPINGYEYRKYLELEEDLWLHNYPLKKHRSFIKPDAGVILLHKRDDYYSFYPIVAGEDKYQQVSGNAIDRAGKNYNVFYELISCNLEINPYALFLSGNEFLKSNGKLKNQYESSFRQNFTRDYEKYHYIWESEKEHSIYKKNWNLVYYKKSLFTEEEKTSILLDVAKKSIEYIKGIMS